ncbi:PD-(D/E)XK nuclease family protein, partial [Acidocella sp.]|uniref:PD-(D/E)XK nuclease family protein n=1 Tax=Acidocella sp. TaxID=50710 RepID=UPI0026251854
CPQDAKPDGVSQTREARTASLPSWAGQAPDWRAVAPAKEAAGVERIRPSRALEEGTRQAVPASPLGGALGRAREQAMSRGTIIHALLEHLPDLAPGARHDAALRFLAAHDEVAGEAVAVAAKVLALLDDPGLAPLFGPGSRAEVPLAGVVAGREIAGIIDRLAVGEEVIWLADYKTDREPPMGGDVPAAYLAQLAAYRAVLGQIYPGREIRAVLVWLEAARGMDVPGEWLDAAAMA